MLIFSLSAAGLVALGLAFLLPPLLRRNAGTGIGEEDAVAAIYRDQLAEIDRDLQVGTLSPGQYESARSEIEQRLAEDLRIQEGRAAGRAGSARLLAVGLAVAIPVFAVGAYLVTGSPAALDPATRLGMPEEDAAQREKMLELTARLAQRMQEHPEDPQGWLMLARSYRALGKLPESVRAFDQLARLRPDDAEVHADLAETIAMQQDGRIDGEALRQAQKALELDPRSEKALALLGTAAYDARRFDEAIGYWERLLTLAPPGTEYAKAVQAGIDEARAAAGGASQGAASPAGTVSGRVALAAGLRDKVDPEATVYIYARAASGPRMPLAVLRRQVKDLPVSFTLDDSMAMAPGATLSAAGALIVGARISRSGDPVAKPGDFEGQVGPVAPGARDLTIDIDREVP